MNTDVDAILLEAVDDVELRQLLDVIELALEANGRPLRVLAGDKARGDLARRGETVLLSDHLCSGARKAVGAYIEGGEYRRGLSLLGAEATEGVGGCCLDRRPLTSSPSCCFVLNCAIPDEGWGGAFKPMSKFVTLLALADIDLPVSVEAVSSMGDVDDDIAIAGRSLAEELCLPKDSFHLDGFFGSTLIAGKGGGDSRDRSLRGIDERDALLISRARD